MSSMIDYWSDLGATLGQGITNYSSASRLLEEQARTRKIQEEDRARQMALQNLQLHQAEAQEARRGGNFAGAAALYQSTLKDRNDFDKGNRVGVKFEGTRTTQNSQRPTPDMSGPMPLPNAYDPSKPDWKNQKNIDLLDAGIGYQAPKEKVKVVPFGAGGLMVVTEHPDGQIETRIEREPTAKASAAKLVQDPVTGEWFTPQPGTRTNIKPTKAGGSKAPKTAKRGTRTETINGRRLLIDSQTGETIRDLGPAGTPKAATVDPFAPVAPPAPAAPATPVAPTPAVPITYGGLSVVDRRHPANKPASKPKPTAKSVGASIWGD